MLFLLLIMDILAIAELPSFIVAVKGELRWEYIQLTPIEITVQLL